MVSSGKHGIRAVAGSLLYTAKRESDWVWYMIFDTSKPDPSGTPLLTRPYLLVLPKLFLKQRESILTYKPMGAILIRATTPFY